MFMPPSAPVLYAPIKASTSGAATIVPAVPGMCIFVLGYTLSAAGSVNVNWQTHVSYSSNAGGLHYLTSGQNIVASFAPVGIFATNVGEALDLLLSGSVAVGGDLVYIVAAGSPNIL